MNNDKFCHHAECRNRPAFSRRTNLQRHLNTVHKSEYDCPDENCSETFKSAKELIFHEKKIHRVVCHLCPESRRATFKHTQKLRRHIEIVHENKERHTPQFCNVCRLQFNSKTEYELHIAQNHQHQSKFVLRNSAMHGDHEDYRKTINTDHAPEVLFSDDYLEEIVTFLQGYF